VDDVPPVKKLHRKGPKRKRREGVCATGDLSVETKRVILRKKRVSRRPNWLPKGGGKGNFAGKISRENGGLAVEKGEHASARVQRGGGRIEHIRDIVNRNPKKLVTWRSFTK